MFQSSLLAWYGVHRRDLPWRRTADPYKILVSEVMLQQTQVARVIPIYEAFLRRFPSLDALAAAELGDVLRAWKGLGYNRRAKFLWQLSKSLPYGNNQKRALPETEEALRKLPGIGHYTAAAILAFSHNRDAIPIDTNIKRIYHRHFRNTNETFIEHTAPAGKARDWNSALMDFGSAVCSKKPLCSTCPLQSTCKAYAEQDFSVPVQKQSTFKESNRYYRGRILEALRKHPHTKTQLLTLGQAAKVEAALASLAAEEMIRYNGKTYEL